MKKTNIKQKKEEKVTIKKAELIKLKEDSKKLKEQHDKYLRSMADYENAKKRLEKEKENSVKFSNENLIGNLLPVIDDFERALSSADEAKDFKNTIAGVKIIKNQFFSVLKSQGLEQIKAEGERFDPNLHEAIGFVETKDHPDNTIVEVLQSGYLFKERLIRPAVVKIAKNHKTS